MAFPSVQARQSSSETEATTHTVTLPAGVVVGETILYVASIKGGPGTAVPAAVWSILRSIKVGSDIELLVAYRKADGTEGGSTTFTTTNTKSSAHIAFRVDGTDAASAPPQCSAGAQGSSGSINPDSFSPSGGAQDYLWLPVGCLLKSHASAITAAPSGYSNFTSKIDGSNTTVATAEKLLNAATEDPGIFTNQSQVWIGVTIAIPPGAATPPPPATGQKPQMVL